MAGLSSELDTLVDRFRLISSTARHGPRGTVP